MPIDTIIFDLGGVLIDWNPRYLYQKIFTDPSEMEYFLSEVATSDWNEEQDAGRPLAEATQWLIDRHPKYEAEIKAFYGRWPEMLGGPIEGKVAILEQLKQGTKYQLFALTNWSAETWPIAWNLYPFLHYFQEVLVSGAEKMRKPDPRFYALLTDRLGIDFATALFIDDNARNVAAARQLGLRTIHFSSPDQLAKDLQGLEVRY